MADLDEHLCLNIFDKSSSAPRYSVHIVDSPTMEAKKFAVFIVPQGRCLTGYGNIPQQRFKTACDIFRESEFLFSTKQGREDLRDTVKFQRLAVVSLNRKHSYESMEQVKGLAQKAVISLLSTLPFNETLLFQLSFRKKSSNLLQNQLCTVKYAFCLCTCWYCTITVPLDSFLGSLPCLW